MINEQKLKLAQERAEAKIGFYIHAAIFIAVNLLLATINLVSDPGTLWFVWPLIGWGMGLLGHAYLVFNPPENSDFKQKLVKKELEKLEKVQKPERVWKEDTHDQSV